MDSDNKKALNEGYNNQDTDIITKNKTNINISKKVIKKESFILYTEHRSIIDTLSNEEAGELFKAIYKYVDGEFPELSDKVEITFMFIKLALDKNAEKYAAICEKNRQNGFKGGAPKGNQNAKKQPKTTERLKKQPKQSKTTLYDKQIVSLTVNKYYSDNEFVKVTLTD